MPDNDFWIGQEQIPVDLSLLLTYHNDEDYWYAPGEYALRVYTVDTLNTNFARPCFALGERKFDPEMEDVSGAIENTLHELLDSGATPEDVYRIMGLVKESELSPETKEADSYLPIDLGYCIGGNIVSYEAVPEGVATVPENVDYPRYAEAMESHVPLPIATQIAKHDLRDKYKAITYNRSDSQYLKEEHREQAPAVLAQAMKNLGVRWPLDYRLHSKAFNDGNVTAHHGIIPQEADAPVSAMEPDEAKVYTAICERYAVQFLPPAVYDVSESTVSVDGGALKLTAKRLSDAGVTAVFPNVLNSRVREDSDTGNPWVPAGSHTLAGISCSITEGETTPPAPYTEGTLITDMASIAKYVKDPEIREILKRKDDGKKGEHGGIGTTATRSSIIEGLKTRGYLEERKGKVRATDKAKAFYALLPPEIRGADVTARWWLIQQDIADGKADVNALQDSVIEVFNHHRETAYVGASIAGAGKTVVGKCPRCGKDVIKTGSIYACSSIKNEKQEDGTWKEVAGCGFKLFGFCTKKFTEKQAASLLDGKAVSLRGCKSKAGKTFDCTVVLQKDGSVEPIFTPRKPTKKGRR